MDPVATALVIDLVRAVVWPAVTLAAIGLICRAVENAVRNWTFSKLGQ